MIFDPVRHFLLFFCLHILNMFVGGSIDHLWLCCRWDAQRLGRDFARMANCSASDLICLKSLSSHDVLRAQVKAGEHTHT